MIKLEFNEYQKKLKDEKLVRIPTEHYYDGVTKIILLFKSREKWEYYTTVLKRDILEFSGMTNIPPEDAIDMFKTNYCSNGMPFEDAGIIDMLEDDDLMAEVEVPMPTITTKGSEIDAGEDIVEEATDYSDFLLKTFNKFEKQVLTAVNKITVEKTYVEKNFGEFLRDMFNSVNTIEFAAKVKRFLKIDLTAGLESAEKELNMDIGFTDAYQDKLNVMQAQQVDGYIINGKKWPGIKGVTKEIQAKIINVVQDGIRDKSSIDDIKKDISGTFDKFSDWRSELIARTETNRILNQGKVLGYKESGLEGRKVWSTAIDSRTSPICLRLNNQQVELDDPFIDPETRQAFDNPPAHGNCRSTVFFEQL